MWYSITNINAPFSRHKFILVMLVSTWPETLLCKAKQP